jgi:hypothetical protein
VLTTNQKGLVAETAIVHECVKLGIGVARPLDAAPYDLILDLGPKLLRVQCKWAVRQGGVVVIRTGRSVNRSLVQLRLAPAKNNQIEGIRWARDHDLGATLSALQGP